MHLGQYEGTPSTDSLVLMLSRLSEAENLALPQSHSGTLLKTQFPGTHFRDTGFGAGSTNVNFQKKSLQVSYITSPQDGVLEY